MFNNLKSNPLPYISCLSNYAENYKSNHIMITAGMDFAWQFAHINYQFFDNVTHLYSNHEKGRRFKFMYSTVDEYFQAIWKN